jgi:hypothetical protein
MKVDIITFMHECAFLHSYMAELFCADGQKVPILVYGGGQHMYVCMYVCMHVCIYVCALECMLLYQVLVIFINILQAQIPLYVCMYVYMHALVSSKNILQAQILLYVCMYAYMYVCMLLR